MGVWNVSFHTRLVRNFVQKYINQKTQVYIRSFSILLGKLVLIVYMAENACSWFYGAY